MKLQNVPLSQIVNNPWRDLDLYPIDKEHIEELKQSIGDHGFFGGIKGRRVDGKVELGCGHARIKAARDAKLETVPIFIDDLDDDDMLRLMSDENATQSGSHPGAIMNEVAAVTRRLIQGLMDSTGRILPVPVAKAFETKHSIEIAKGRLAKRQVDSDADIPIGHYAIRRYLGKGNPADSHRTQDELRNALAALKQAARYDEIIDEALSKYPTSVDEESTSKDVVKKKGKPRKRIYDAACMSVFPNVHQAHAFREAVTTAVNQRCHGVERAHADFDSSRYF